MFKQTILILLLVFGLTGCNFLPKLTFNRTTSTLPSKTEKADKQVVCKGEIKLDKFGKVISCSEGYKSNEKTLNVAERKFTFFEHIGNFFSNLQGWFGILVLASIVLSFMGFGGIIWQLWINAFGVVGRALKALGRGIQAGKAYVRNNGVKYTEAERVIYLAGADDLLKALDDAIDDKEVEKLIYKIRAELKYEK